MTRKDSTTRGGTNTTKIIELTSVAMYELAKDNTIQEHLTERRLEVVLGPFRLRLRKTVSSQIRQVKINGCSPTITDGELSSVQRVPEIVNQDAVEDLSC